ncbi:MAG: hypothetical protein AB7P07_03475 [Hyphomonadaceae bacterium]
MAAALKALFDKKKLALTRARLNAWWEGEDFNEESALQAIEASLANAPMDGADDELFDEPPFDAPPRLVALSKLWGEGRIRPGDDTLDVLEPARLGLGAEGVLALLGPGLAGPVVAIAGVHPGKIEVFEWREETIEALKYGVRKAKLDERVTVTRIDLEAHVWPAMTYDALLSIDDFAYVGFPPHLAHQIIKCLKPGASAVLECYAGLPSPDMATAFASSFAEPQIRAAGDILQCLRDVGLSVDTVDDLTEEFLELARQRFKQLGEVLSADGGLEPAAARELAWEAEAWRTRLRLLAQRRLERRRFIARRPAEGASDPEAAAPAEAQPEENANTPES